MNYILLNFLVLVPGILLSPLSPVGSQSESSVELTSLSRLVEAVSKLRKNQQDDDRIDLDYFGVFDKFGSDDDHYQHANDENRFHSVNPPRYVFISNPEVLNDYQKLKHVTVVRSSEAATLGNDDLGNLSVKDILEFLIQVEARMAEREGRTAGDHKSISFSKLEKILRNLRRQNEDYHGSDEGPLGTSSFISDAKKKTQHIRSESDTEERVRTTKRKKKSPKKRERIALTTMKHFETMGHDSNSNELRPYRDVLKKRGSMEIPKPKRFLQNNDRFRAKRVKDRVPGFIGTPIPMLGKKIIYETNK